MVTKPSLDNQDRIEAKQRSGGWFSSLLVTIFRLLLLGVGSVSALLFGIAIATVFPGDVETTPPLERILETISDFR